MFRITCCERGDLLHHAMFPMGFFGKYETGSNPHTWKL
jgi:hypothetical protein